MSEDTARYPTDIVDLGDDVFAIDTRIAGLPGITSSYLIRSERPCLVEVGTAGSAPLLRDAVVALGVPPEELATVVVTHIHLDHAGGVGDIARMFGNAEIVVHERGARHLAEPDRLVSSARRVFGAVFDQLFGELRPTDPARLRTVTEAGHIDLGAGRSLTSYDTPGHARHHVGLLDSATGDLYVGDAAGVYDAHATDLRPATPPPEFDLDAAVDSLRRFTELRPQRLMFSHFGAVTEVEPTLERAVAELRLWVETVRKVHDTGGDLDHAVAMVRDQLVSRYAEPDNADAESRQVIDVLSGAHSNTSGIWRWLEKTGGAARTEAGDGPSSGAG